MEVGVASNESEIQFLQAMEKSPAFSGIKVDQVRPVTTGSNAGPDCFKSHGTVRHRMKPHWHAWKKWTGMALAVSADR